MKVDDKVCLIDDFRGLSICDDKIYLKSKSKGYIIGTSSFFGYSKNIFYVNFSGDCILIDISRISLDKEYYRDKNLNILL